MKSSQLIALGFAAILPLSALAADGAPEGGCKGGPQHGPVAQHEHRGPEQGHKGPRHHGRDPMLRMMKDLDLSKEQMQAIGKLHKAEKHHERKIARSYLDKLPEAQKKAMHDEMKASHDKTRAEVRKVLTPEQQARFDEKLARMEKHRKEMEEFRRWKAEHKQDEHPQPEHKKPLPQDE